MDTIPNADLGLPLGDLDRLAKLLLVLGHPDAAPAAPGRRLYHDRVADLPRRLDDLVGRSGLFRAWHHGNVGLFGQQPRRGFVAHLLDSLGRRPDEDQPRIPAGRRETGVLGQETVAGMDRVSARLPGGFDDGLHIQVALAGRWRPDVDGLVGVAHVERLLVRVGVDGDGGYPNSRHARTTRSAISPRFATSTLSNIAVGPPFRFHNSGASSYFEATHLQLKIH